MGANIKEQEFALDRLSAKYATNADSIVESLRQVSKETISNAELMSSSAKALQLGLDPTAVRDLMEMYVALRPALGDSAKTLMSLFLEFPEVRQK